MSMEIYNCDIRTGSSPKKEKSRYHPYIVVSVHTFLSLSLHWIIVLPSFTSRFSSFRAAESALAVPSRRAM